MRLITIPAASMLGWFCSSPGRMGMWMPFPCQSDPSACTSITAAMLAASACV